MIPRKPRTIWPLLFFLLLPVLALWRAVFLGGTIGAFGAAPLKGMAPDSDLGGWVDPLKLDSALQFLPWRDLVLSSWKQGEVPFWNPYVLCGTPLLDNSQSGALYPPHVLLGLLGVPAAVAITLLAWFHLFIAGFGVFKLTERLGANTPGAAAAGALFTTTPFLLHWLPLASVITTVCWIPLALHSLSCLMEQPKWAYALRLGLFVGLMLLGGHLQFAFYGMLALGVFGLARCPGNWKRAPLAIGAVLLGVIVAWGQLSLVLEYSQFSHRRAPATEAGFQAYAGTGLQMMDLSLLVSSGTLGSPDLRIKDAQGSIGFWPYTLRPNAVPPETATTVGLVGLIALLFVPWRSRSSWAPAALGIVGLLIAFPTPLGKLLYFGIPGFSATGSPGRALVLFLLAACVLAGIGLSRVIEDGMSKRDMLKFAGVGVSALLLIFVAPTAGLSQEVIAQRQQMIAQGVLDGFLQFAFSAIVVAIGLGVALKSKAAQTPALLSAILGVAVVNGLFQLVPASKVPSYTHTNRYERQMVVTNPIYFFSAEPPNWNILTRTHRVEGYDSLVHRDTVAAYRNALKGLDPAPPINGNMLLINDPDAALNLGAAVAIGPEGEEVPIGGKRVEGGKIISEKLNSVVIEANTPGRVILRDRMMPGWTATVDGQPTEIDATDGWRSVEAKRAGSKIEFHYDPGSGKAWFTIFASFLLILLVIGLQIRAWAKPEESLGSPKLNQKENHEKVTEP